MSVIASYKFDSTVCADFTPEFNSEFTSDLYTITDVDNGDGTTTRTIESDSLPTSMRFGSTGSTSRSGSLLQMLECNTDNITSMNSMFKNCTNLTFINLSNFNTQNVTNMDRMFNGCSKLTSLDLSSFNTEKVTNMSYMFYSCSGLISLDVSNFNTSQVTTMCRMFNTCFKLTSLDVSSFNTSQVTNMERMFYSCSGLISLDVSNFDTSQVTDMDSILTNIPSLTNIGAVYCDSSTINKISKLVATNTTIWYMDAKLEDLIVKDNITYKEYKSNILTVNDDVTLQSVGEVHDTIDCLTGEMIECISETVLNGSESWHITNNTFRTTSIANEVIKITTATDKTKIFISCDKYESRTYNDTWTSGKFISLHADKLIVIRDENFTTVQEWKQYLSQNPLTVKFVLATPTIKTVDLTVVDQDNQPTQLGTFENITHVSLEAENLIPEVEMEVATIISEELASASPLMDDILTKQERLNTTIDEQSNNVDATMVATTEIFEETL